MLKDKFFNLIEARLVKIVNPPGEISQSTRICLDSVARTYSNIFVHFYDLDRQNLVINWTWNFRGYYPWFRFVKTRLYSGPFHLFGDEGKLCIKHAVNRQDKRKNAQDDVLKKIELYFQIVAKTASRDFIYFTYIWFFHPKHAENVICNTTKNLRSKLIFLFFISSLLSFTQNILKYFSAKTKFIKQIFLIFLMLYIEEKNVYTLKVFYKDSILV